MTSKLHLTVAPEVTAEKLQAFEGWVTPRLSQDLQLLAPQGVMKIGGSFGKGHKLRPCSDIDIVVVSRELAKPENYKIFLDAVSQMSREYFGSTGTLPIWFTSDLNQAAVQYIAQQAHSKRVEQIVPCHLRFYPSVEEAFRREARSKALSLFTTSRLKYGNEPKLPVADDYFEEVPKKGRRLRWELEKAIADLLMNRNLLPAEFLFMNFERNVTEVLRQHAQEVLPIGADSLDHLLAKFEAMGLNGLKQAFEAIVEARMGKGDNFDELAAPALMFLQVLEYY